MIAASADGERCDTPELAAAALAPHFVHLERESLVVALLSRKHRLTAVVPVYAGNVAGTSVRIGELFTEAVRRNASGILLAHTSTRPAIRRRPPTTCGRQGRRCGRQDFWN